MDGELDTRSPDEQENPNIDAGFTFLGQFIDHDITFDPTPISDLKRDREANLNYRTPGLDLDSVYGGGPVTSPHLYDRAQPGRFLLGASEQDEFDLPRNRQEIALIADPRNDENLIISQLHLAFLRAHNFRFDELASRPGTNAKDTFEEARRNIRWLYQWIVVNEYLPRVCSERVLKKVKDPGGPRLYDLPQEIDSFIPIEFKYAAFRFGHSQVRPGYQLNGRFREPVPIFAATQEGDLRGGRRILPSWRVDWRMFFSDPAVQGQRVQRSMRIDEKISPPLLDLPSDVLPPEDAAPRSLASRTLRRGLSAGLPSGLEALEVIQRIDGEAKAIPLDALWAGVDGVAKDSPAPLWYYILREAAHQEQGKRLGDVGSWIVADVLYGLIEKDAESYLSKQPGWAPPGMSAEGTSPRASAMMALLDYAGVSGGDGGRP